MSPNRQWISGSGKRCVSCCIGGAEVLGWGLKSVCSRQKKGTSGESGYSRITRISQRKNIIAELIVVILFEKFFEEFLGSNTNICQWELLAFPISILFLALSLRCLNLKGEG